MRRTLLPLTPLLMALALLPTQTMNSAESSPKPVAAPVSTPAVGLNADQAQFWNDAQKEVANADGKLTPEQLESEAKYAEALAQYRQAHFAEAQELIEAAVRLNPVSGKAQELRQNVLAVLSQRDNRLQMAATWFHTLQDVKTQEAAVRLAALLASGDRKMSVGDFAGAELDYDRVDVGLRSLPYQFDWGKLPAEVVGKRLEARAASRKAETDNAKTDRERAVVKAKEESDLQQQALNAKVDELIRRAKVSFERKDYRRAEVDAWNAYELDRRRDDARNLYLKARREGHFQFDDRYRDQSLERQARLNEELNKSLIPQTELLVYPEDWSRRELRKPREIGQNKIEPWMQALNDRLEQRVTFDFQDQGFEEVVTFLRQVTGVNIVVAPSVAAKGGGTVTLKVKDMRFKYALKWILELTSLHYALQDQALYISDTAINGALVLRMYDITDLISPVTDQPGKELAYNASGGGGGGGINLFGGGKTEENGNKRSNPEELVDFIKKNVAPKSWELEGVGIEQRGGSTLFVTSTPEIHSLIDSLLDAKRKQESLQVSVNVRLLDVRKGFFEEIGVDYRNQQGDPNLLASNTNAGYTRVNNNAGYVGVLNNSRALPGNQVNPGYTALSNTVQNNHGMTLEVSQSPFNFLGTDQINAIFTASEEESDLRVLNHPEMTCYNNQRANAAFITQFAYISDYEVVTGNLDPKIAVLSFGDIIDVRPVVSSDRKYITMEIRPSSVNLEGVFTELITAPRVINPGGVNGGGVVVIGTPYPLELPNVLVRTLRSSVMLPDKASLLIGGFSSALQQRTHTGIPFLSHIPFLGRLFSRNGTYDQSRKVMYLLNAKVVDLGEIESLQ